MGVANARVVCFLCYNSYLSVKDTSSSSHVGNVHLLRRLPLPHVVATSWLVRQNVVFLYDILYGSFELERIWWKREMNPASSLVTGVSARRQRLFQRLLNHYRSHSRVKRNRV